MKKYLKIVPKCGRAGSAALRRYSVRGKKLFGKPIQIQD